VSLEFFVTWSFRPHCGRGVDLASKRNSNRKNLCGVRWLVRRADNLVTFLCPLSWNVWETQLAGTHMVFLGCGVYKNLCVEQAC